MATDKDRIQSKDENRDPLSGEPGAHPVGTGVGAAVGGGVLGTGLGAVGAAAAAAGGTLGAAAGPAGVILGAVAGGIAGGLAGKAVAEKIDPTAEHTYWEKNYQSRPYVDKGAPYEEYRPAYQYGWESRTQYTGRNFDEIEPELRTGWEKSQSRMNWDRARHAARDAWDRVGTRPTGSTPPSNPTR